MNAEPHYQAFWVADEDHVQEDDGLRLAVAWLGSVPCSGAKVVVVNVLRAIQYRRWLPAATSRCVVVSPQSQNRVGLYGGPGNAVLALWPAPVTLDLAENLALRGALCVVPGTLNDARPWIARTGARNLWNADDVPEPLAELPAAVKDGLDHIISFDGHNDFLGAGGKEQGIRTLRGLIQDGYRPDPQDVENYVRSQPGVRTHEGARRLSVWYDGLLKGKSFRDYGGRRI